ncbi:MAG: OB-fold putative lipoprotein [Bacteroidales bacterium]|nr:OB-fold putative lipoprotein [Bacteroidales bacterium]
MKKRKKLRIIILTAAGGLIIGGALTMYMFNMPHRDVTETDPDYYITSTEIVNEYLANSDTANEKYLAADGDSKILEITGNISDISEDFDGNAVVLLKGENDRAGVRVTFTGETEPDEGSLSVGQQITVKGVIRSGAAYDKDLEMYENVIIEKSVIIQ